MYTKDLQVSLVSVPFHKSLCTQAFIAVILYSVIYKKRAEHTRINLMLNHLNAVQVSLLCRVSVVICRKLTNEQTHTGLVLQFAVVLHQVSDNERNNTVHLLIIEQILFMLVITSLAKRGFVFSHAGLSVLFVCLFLC